MRETILNSVTTVCRSRFFSKKSVNKSVNNQKRIHSIADEQKKKTDPLKAPSCDVKMIFSVLPFRNHGVDGILVLRKQSSFT
jgi:hypothetical protein